MPTAHLVDQKYTAGYLAFKIHPLNGGPRENPPAVRLKNIRVLTDHPERYVRAMNLPPRPRPSTPGKYDEAAPPPGSAAKSAAP